VSGYTALNRLLLDNNKMGLTGALLLSEVLPSLQLSELNIGFNEIEADGLISIVKSLVHNSYLHSLALSGNAIDGEVSRLIAFMLVHNSALEKLYLDRTNMDSRSEKNIAAGLASSKSSALRTLTGFSLGPVLTSLGSPSVLETLSNDRVLRYLSQMWASQKEAERIELEASQTNIVGDSSNTAVRGSDSVGIDVSADEKALGDGKDMAAGYATDSVTMRSPNANNNNNNSYDSNSNNSNSNEDNSNKSSRESVEILLAEDLHFMAGSCCYSDRERGSISAFSSQRVSEADIADSPPSSSSVLSTSIPSSSAGDADVIINTVTADTMDIKDGITNTPLFPLNAEISEHFDGYKEGDMIKRFSFAGVYLSVFIE
jgi:hypothetical protein